MISKMNKCEFVVYFYFIFRQLVDKKVECLNCYNAHRPIRKNTGLFSDLFWNRPINNDSPREIAKLTNKYINIK